MPVVVHVDLHLRHIEKIDYNGVSQCMFQEKYKYGKNNNENLIKSVKKMIYFL